MAKVHELIAVLAACPADAEVMVWLPGSRIKLGGVTVHHDGTWVLIEGNLTPRSVLAGGDGEVLRNLLGEKK